MRVTIIPDDTTIMVDGVACLAPSATYPANVHAIQWYGEYGTIERKVGPQETFTDVGEIQSFIDLHADLVNAVLAEKPFSALKAEEISYWLDVRKEMLSRVDQIASRFARAGDMTTAVSCDAVAAGLLTMFEHESVTSATDITALRLALKTRYLTAVAAANATAKAEFKRYDK